MVALVGTAKPYAASRRSRVKSLADALIEIGAFDEYAIDQQKRHATIAARTIIALMPEMSSDRKSCARPTLG